MGKSKRRRTYGDVVDDLNRVRIERDRLAVSHAQLQRQRDRIAGSLGVAQEQLVEIASALRAWAQTDRGQHASDEAMEVIAEQLGLPVDWDDPWWEEGSDAL